MLQTLISNNPLVSCSLSHYLHRFLRWTHFKLVSSTRVLKDIMLIRPICAPVLHLSIFMIYFCLLLDFVASLDWLSLLFNNSLFQLLVRVIWSCLLVSEEGSPANLYQQSHLDHWISSQRGLLILQLLHPMQWLIKSSAKIVYFLDTVIFSDVNHSHSDVNYL